MLHTYSYLIQSLACPRPSLALSGSLEVSFRGQDPVLARDACSKEAVGSRPMGTHWALGTGQLGTEHLAVSTAQ